jgi:hypothetical protein
VILPANTPQHPTTAVPQQAHRRGAGKGNGQHKERGQQPAAAQ